MQHRSSFVSQVCITSFGNFQPIDASKPVPTFPAMAAPFPAPFDNPWRFCVWGGTPVGRFWRHCPRCGARLHMRCSIPMVFGNGRSDSEGDDDSHSEGDGDVPPGRRRRRSASRRRQKSRMREGATSKKRPRKRQPHRLDLTVHCPGG